MLARKSFRGKRPLDTDTYAWTSHAVEKMRHYGISESRVKRIVRFPTRSEEGILEGAVAAMQPAGKQEIWVMYILENPRESRAPICAGEQDPFGILKKEKRIKVITAWRYPGVSPKRDPVPAEVLDEIRSLF